MTIPKGKEVYANKNICFLTKQKLISPCP